MIRLTYIVLTHHCVEGRCTARHGHSAVDVSALQIRNGKCDICAGIAGVMCSGSKAEEDHCTCIDGPYVLRHCVRHGRTPGKPTIEEGHTLCNRCREDTKHRSRIGHIKRKTKRKKEHHYLRSQLPKFEVDALEHEFAKIDLQNLKPAGVTSALRDLHGSHCFLYPGIELTVLHTQYGKRMQYHERKAKRLRLLEVASVSL